MKPNRFNRSVIIDIHTNCKLLNGKCFENNATVKRNRVKCHILIQLTLILSIQWKYTSYLKLIPLCKYAECLNRQHFNYCAFFHVKWATIINCENSADSPKSPEISRLTEIACVSYKNEIFLPNYSQSQLNGRE